MATTLKGLVLVVVAFDDSVWDWITKGTLLLAWRFDNDVDETAVLARTIVATLLRLG